MTKEEAIKILGSIMVALKMPDTRVSIGDADEIYEAVKMGAGALDRQKTGEWSVNEVGVVRCPFCHSNMNPRKNRKPKYCDECGARLKDKPDTEGAE